MKRTDYYLGLLVLDSRQKKLHITLIELKVVYVVVKTIIKVWRWA